MALENSNYGEGERWEAQNEELPEGKHLGTLFEFKCWEARDEKDYVSFGFQVDGLKVQRFYCLTTKSGKSLGWKLEKDMRTLLGTAPPASELQVDGRTGRLVLMSAVDNLMKGQAGQGVQCLNLMSGLSVSEGLPLAPFYP